MSDLSYPFVFVCSGCDNEITLTRDDVREVLQLSEPDFDSVDTVAAVLKRRGWVPSEFEGSLLCPECAVADESGG